MLSDDLLKKVVKGTAAGMEHLHQEGVVHRGKEYLKFFWCISHDLLSDLAARNILLKDNYEPKVSDFGMSRFCKTDTGTTRSEVG